MATMQHLTEEQKNTMRIQNRPETLWEYVTYENVVCLVDYQQP